VLGSRQALIGVNDRRQLREVDELLARRIVDWHARRGVTIRGLPRIDDTVEIEADAIIEDNVQLRGTTRIGAGATIDVGCVLTDSVVEPCASLKPYSVVVSSRIGPGAQIGPFAHLRPGSEIDQEARIGNFVETKKTRLRRGAKANHLAYLGDGDIGERANIGAGTIFCNYDGFRKHRTVVGEGVFVGSDSQIVAPVTIGQGAYVATGTTVTEDIPAEALAIGRARQQNKPGYATGLRERLRNPDKAK
jgi:bifunctional UDP-N-acetylglucosamine pyrophosphorylase/glucosamine-1-phosphate N-acetyltransferase